MLSNNGFMPHGHCYLWKPALVWMMAGSDLLIGLSYFFISISLVIIIRRVKLPFSGMFFAFGLFIAACGLGHFIDLVTLWKPYYWVSASVRVVTAAASIVTAILMIPMVPRLTAVATGLRRLNALREKEARDFEATLSASPDQIYRMDPNGHFEYLSSSALKFLKMEKSAALGKRWFDLGLPAEVVNALESARIAVIEAREPRIGEFAIPHPAGTYSFEYVLFPILDAQGTLLGICANFRDITEKRFYENTLRDMQERFRLLVNGVKDYAIYMLDPEGRVMSWNDGASRIKGYSEPEVIGKHFSIFYSPEDIEKGVPQQALDRALVNTRSEGEGWRTRKDGSRFYANYVISTLRTADGRLRGFAKITHDVTEKKLAEDKLRLAYEDLERRVEERTEELKQSNEKFQASQREFQELVHTVDGIVWEAAVGKPGYTFVSRQVERILGYPIERWLGEGGFWKSILHPEDRDRLTGDKYLSPEQKTDTQLEYRLIRSDGKIVWLRDHIKVLRDAGVPVKMRGIMVDITERKNTEEELQLAQQSALQASAVKSEFLANVTHEIRTPLNAIIGMATIGLDTQSRDEQQECLSTVKTAADSLLTLINDILDFSKVEAGKVELEVSDFNLPSVCKNAIEVISPSARSKELALNLEFGDGCIQDVRGDSGRLLQVFLNLLSNAAKFSSQKGRVSFRANVMSKSEDGRTTVRFEVQDEGVGISEAAMNRLFQPFSQADASTARKYGGTGLGLSICKNLVTLMGGKIGAQSEPGKGSLFWLEIPFEPARAPVVVSDQANGKTASADFGGKVHVLVAEDNPANQKVVRRFLEKLGCRIEVVGNGQEAVTSFGSGKFDLIFMDCQMPEMDGYSATRRIREIEKTKASKRTPIIALTAHAFSGDREECEKSGMDGYLTKPIRLGELEGAIRQWLSASPSYDYIDIRYLEEIGGLKSEGQTDLVLELIEIFKSAGPEKISRIKTAFAGADLTALEKESHSLKSTCHNVGGKALASVCEEIESSARRKDQSLLDRGPQLLADLETGYKHALRELTEIAKKRS